MIRKLFRRYRTTVLYGAYKDGFTNLQSGHYEVAIKSFDKAVSLVPAVKQQFMPDIFAEIFYLRARAKVSLSRYDDALADFDKAVSLSPNGKKGARTFSRRGFAKYMLGQYEEAIKDFKQAISLDPDDASALQGINFATEKLLKQHQMLANARKLSELVEDFKKSGGEKFLGRE